MKKILFVFYAAVFSMTVHATPGINYLSRFMAYSEWNQNLPEEPNAKFLAFVDSETPLATKLREKWLYKLARQRDWLNFNKHYKNSKDVSLQCLSQIAKYNLEKQQEALQTARRLWLSGESQPPSCNQLFDLFIKSPAFNEQLLKQRIILALDKRNLNLARYLLKQYKEPRRKDEQLLLAIYQNPNKILQLENGYLHDYFYLFGLKRMVSVNMDRALSYWQLEKTKHMLSLPQQQSFLAHVALYKAMRNHDDAPQWFAKIQPAYYNDVLLDWRIRLALKREEWNKVENLASQYHDQRNPCWQYWLARALEKRGQKEKAKQIYQQLAATRHYYGFLASLRLKQTMNFQNEWPVNDMNLLKPYQPVTENIKSLYYNKQALEASRLLTDFISELPKEDKSALLYWITNELHWYSKSVYLSNDETLTNQLLLRFPLAYRSVINQYTQNYRVHPALVYAIIRQESGFREDVVSPAGARGLMQLMPATASLVAKHEKIAYGDKGQLFSTQKNINIGIAYLQQLAKRFNSHPLLIAAAYNAGPRQVVYWLKNHPPKQIDIWIETLPWRETRNYLKNIIAFYAVYQYRLQAKPDLGAFMKPL